MSSIRKKVKWSRKGVSEIIGNILILGITVTLFSSIMVFVANMPPPQENAYADFSVSQRWIHGGQVQVNITHIGGQELKNSTTKIMLTFNSRQQVLNISQSANPHISGSKWVTGV
ncbi:MAG TPA: type IV pilin, partial [Methanomassiliicoccales archaeon]|nr:type IV pilin [Methanomassiliicoccales archaeon]